MTFKFIAGDLALDFVNTVSWGRDHAPAGGEKFNDYADVVNWARQAGVVSARARTRLTRAGTRQRAAGARVLRRSKALRRALHAILVAMGSGGRPDADWLCVVESEVSRVPLRLAPTLEGGLNWHWEDEGGDALDAILWPVVWQAVDLLRSAEALAHVKACAGDTCGWLFLDQSRRHNRRWCDMADCGNRAKVRRYYRRHRKD